MVIYEWLRHYLPIGKFRAGVNTFTALEVLRLMKRYRDDYRIYLLNKYTKFLQEKGYLDDDATMEEPNAIDEFIKHETSTDI